MCLPYGWVLEHNYVRPGRASAYEGDNPKHGEGMGVPTLQEWPERLRPSGGGPIIRTMDTNDFLALLGQGAAAWNEWRSDHPDVVPEFRDVNLDGRDLEGFDFHRAKFVNVLMQKANLSRACFDEAFVKDTLLTDSVVERAMFRRTNFYRSRLINLDLRSCAFSPLMFSETLLWNANFSGCDLKRANFSKCDLHQARLTQTQLDGASLTDCDLTDAQLQGARLADADLQLSAFIGADLSGAQMERANLTGAYLVSANLTGADLTEASLQAAVMINTRLKNCTLDRSRVFGISTWNIDLSGAMQDDLVITHNQEPVITSDNLEVAQFTYLLLHNQKLRGVIDSITSKAVLILGRFTPERKAVLDAIREALRAHNFVPMMFDFEKPTDRDFSETVMTLASMCRFIVSDITNPSSNPLELQLTVPNFAIPLVPIIEQGQRPFAMFRDLYGKYDWVLPPLEYDTIANLLKHFQKAIIDPALEKHRELMIQKARAMPTRSLKDFDDG
jgi:uncharacterized protein YjbI with pentapeptide repeats